MGIYYYFDIPIEEPLETRLNIAKSSATISYLEIFILLYLIQYKSNYLFSISLLEKDKAYSDGLIRLFIALFSLERDHSDLLNLGWEYDSHNGRFKLNYNRSISKKERASKKYYLTNEELGNILKTES